MRGAIDAINYSTIIRIHKNYDEEFLDAIGISKQGDDLNDEFSKLGIQRNDDDENSLE